VPAGNVTDLILEAGGPLIQRVDLYDHFEGGKIGPGQKSLTFSLVFQSAEKTLSDEEVNPVFMAIVGALSDKLGAGLRE
jgi:phenylalanyl-tRNA synthetase beta chain